MCIQVSLAAFAIVNNFYDFCLNQILSENPCNFLAINLMIKKTLPVGALGKNNFILCTFFFTVVVLLCVSCRVTKPSQYFSNLKKDTTLINAVSADFELKIMKGDRISISVTSLSSLEDALFNSAGVGGGASGTSASKGGGYLIPQDGNVLLHRVGTIQAAGLTRKELSKKLEVLLLAFMKEPIVQINFLNHKVTVMGEVRTPQVISMTDEPLSIIDALILSGDVTANAKRNNIAIIRQEGNERKVKHVNLEDNSIFSSPLYYVQPNDIILVSADNERFEKEENRRKLQTTLSLVASGISFLIIVLDRIIK